MPAGEHPGRPEPHLLRLLTPDDRPGRYLAFSDPRPIAEVAADYRRDYPAPSVRSWTPVPLNAIDLFGSAVRFDRPRLIRLYGARRVQVARGPISRDGRVIESVTLLSPYPDAAFAALQDGTLILVRRIAPVDP
jgi:hypothetical protein